MIKSDYLFMEVPWDDDMRNMSFIRIYDQIGIGFSRRLQILPHRNKRRSVARARTAPSLQKRKAAPGCRTGEEDYRIAADPVQSLLLRWSLRHLRPSPEKGGRRRCRRCCGGCRGRSQ
ncbi:hypothetical protein MRB53_014193 [Persea americana]|uniref:Uncharacterized protein n=1 Tax=Persea americana TaxID=3435 RepID=A0ACC2KAJ7_PERAE|nr:hypothetical protein MRB53_014193 [Persea americana]